MTQRWRYHWLKMQARGLLLANRPAAALRRFDAMLVSAPQDRYALASRAHVLVHTGDVAGGVQVLCTLTAKHPDDATAWFNLAYALETHGDTVQAERAFRRALAVDGTLDRAWYGLALLLIRALRLDEAVAALECNTRLQPMSPYGWYQLARVQLARHQPDETRRIIRHLKGFEPKVAAQLERETGLDAHHRST